MYSTLVAEFKPAPGVFVIGVPVTDEGLAGMSAAIESAIDETIANGAPPAPLPKAPRRR